MLVIGLTGGIGTGKSTVAEMLRAAGVPVIDADQVARDVVEPGQPALEAIVNAFGAEALDPTGRLDRAAMRRRIAADPSSRRRLEAVTHPAIFAEMAQRLQRLREEGVALAAVEAALMVETGSYRAYPVLVVVTCDPATQLARVMARDQVDEAAARAIIATQLPLADKEAVATYVLRNDADRAALQAQVDHLLGELAP